MRFSKQVHGSEQQSKNRVNSCVGVERAVTKSYRYDLPPKLCKLADVGVTHADVFHKGLRVEGVSLQHN